MDPMGSDQDMLSTAIAIVTMLSNDYEEASRIDESSTKDKKQLKMEKMGEIAAKIVEQLQKIISGLKRISNTPAVMVRIFSPDVLKNLCSQMGRYPYNSELFNLSRDIVDDCFKKMDLEIFIREGYAASIGDFLKSGKITDEPKRIVLNLIRDLIDGAKPGTIHGMKIDDASKTFLAIITGCLLTSSNEIAAAASNILVRLCHRAAPADGIDVVFGNDAVTKRLRAVLDEKDEVIRFRLFNMIGQISIVNEWCFKRCVGSGFVDLLLRELDSDNFIRQRNAMGVITFVVTRKTGTDHCLRYFHRVGLLRTLHGLVAAGPNSPNGAFLFPAAMKFFSQLVRVYPEECYQDFPKFFDSVFQMVCNYKEYGTGQRLLAFESLSFIGSTTAGKRILASKDDEMHKCMRAFGTVIKQGPIDARVSLINGIALLLTLNRPDETDESLLGLHRRWFGWLQSSGSEEDACRLFFELLRNPALKIRRAAGLLFVILANQDWGVRLIAEQAGLLNYLLDRTTETTAEGRYLKYGLVNILSESRYVARYFTPADVRRLAEYVNDGPAGPVMVGEPPEENKEHAK